MLINVAATLDGKIDTVERRGAAISSERDRHRVDVLRASVDAVMVGGRTLLGEDPRLLVRSAELRAERVARGAPEHPAKVGIVSRPNLRLDSRFLTTGPARIILFTPARPARVDVTTAKPTPGAAGGGPATVAAVEREPSAPAMCALLRARGVEVYAVGEGRVDLAEAMRTLGQLGIARVLVEGGGSLNFELLRRGLVDEVHVFLAPLVFGGATAPTLADGDGLVRDLALPLTRTAVEAWDDGGLVLRYTVEHRPNEA